MRGAILDATRVESKGHAVVHAPQPKRWLAFLNELWPDDPDTIGALQEMFGYLVSGDTRQQKMFLLVGPKRGGKGTIGRVLIRMIGRHHVAGPTLASLGTNFGLQDIIGKPVALVSDARIGGKSDASLIAERLLSISGEDLQNVDRKYLPPWSGYLPTRFVVLTNELPRFTDASGALASRFVVLMLHKSFYGNENPELTEELCQELPGIFNWSLDGLQKLRARGRFVQPVQVLRQSKKWRTWRALSGRLCGTSAHLALTSHARLTPFTSSIDAGAKTTGDHHQVVKYLAAT